MDAPNSPSGSTAPTTTPTTVTDKPGKLSVIWGYLNVPLQIQHEVNFNLDVTLRPWHALAVIAGVFLLRYAL